MSNTLKEQVKKLSSVDASMLKKEVAELGGRVPEQLETNKILQEILRQLQYTNFFLQAITKYSLSPSAYQELLKSLKEVESVQNHLECNDNEDERQYDNQM